MNLDGNTVLVTGGASGIGLAFVERFIRAGSRVLVCGRREERLRELAQTHRGVATCVCDVAEASERIALIEWATAEFPTLSVLVNNAGIQRYPDLAEAEDWTLTRLEIAINLEAPIHLSRLILPHLLRRPHAAIINIGSGLAFAPLARAPIYSATKAALHSFTVSLRHQLLGSTVEIVGSHPSSRRYGSWRPRPSHLRRPGRGVRGRRNAAHRPRGAGDRVRLRREGANGVARGARSDVRAHEPAPLVSRMVQSGHAHFRRPRHGFR